MGTVGYFLLGMDFGFSLGYISVTSLSRSICRIALPLPYPDSHDVGMSASASTDKFHTKEKTIVWLNIQNIHMLKMVRPDTLDLLEMSLCNPGSISSPPLRPIEKH